MEFNIETLIVYLHIPFCHRVCPYCSFYKHTPGDTDLRAFIQALLKEARAAPNTHIKGEKITTLYLGGGTPSMLSPRHLTELFEGLHEALPLTNTHITLEANPATFGHAKAALFKDLGVNRTSLGIQSFSPHLLKTLGREHNPEQAAEAVHTLRASGMEEINLDLMFSIPGQTIEDWRHSLDTAIGLKPNHISAYNLTYEEDTPFFDSLQNGRYSEDEDNNAEMFSLAHHALTGANFLHYETSNYAQPGKESQHNLSYWHGHDYLSLGPSAVSTINGNRWKNIPDTARYIDAINTVGHAMRDIETIDAEAFRIERIALLLRTTQGLPSQYLNNAPSGAVDQLLENKLAIHQNGHLQLVNDGPMLVDAIAAQLV
ncbi:MAG: radical SAM family heme chaperone HemW [Verrucomicrobiae bacterium]|nr:radical SAM family heme chaperone HemW [Verrucomicrobiae bacterium]NNJ43555.1 radical SAM family heme chaperone HemW [Akkermansiaceae bacterium]